MTPPSNHFNLPSTPPNSPSKERIAPSRYMAIKKKIKSGGEQAAWITLELKVKSIFSPAAPIDEANLFAGRTDQIRRLLDAIAERGRHAILFGERGVGKTSLANIFHMLIGHSLQKKIIRIRKQASPLDDYNTLWRKIFRDLEYTKKSSIGYGREEVKIHSILDGYKDAITPDDVIRELEIVATQSSPVIIFDEFDKIEDIRAKRMMAHTMKSLSDNGVDATIVIVGVADDIDTLVEEHESVKRNIQEIRMPRMSKEELNEILNERLPLLGMKITGDARWKIVTLSRGLPEYIHALGRNAAVIAVQDKRKLVNENDVDAAIKLMMQESDQSTNNNYKNAVHSNQANALYQQVILACALAETNDEGRFTLTSVLQPLKKILGRSVDIAHFQSHITAFCGSERGKILEKSGAPRAYKYRFREPKMQPYVIMQGIRSNIIGNDALTILAAPEQPSLFPTEL